MTNFSNNRKIDPSKSPEKANAFYEPTNLAIDEWRSDNLTLPDILSINSYRRNRI